MTSQGKTASFLQIKDTIKSTDCNSFTFRVELFFLPELFNLPVLGISNWASIQTFSILRQNIDIFPSSSYHCVVKPQVFESAVCRLFQRFSNQLRNFLMQQQQR